MVYKCYCFWPTTANAFARDAVETRIRTKLSGDDSASIKISQTEHHWLVNIDENCDVYVALGNLAESETAEEANHILDHVCAEPTKSSVEPFLGGQPGSRESYVTYAEIWCEAHDPEMEYFNDFLLVTEAVQDILPDSLTFSGAADELVAGDSSTAGEQ